MSQNFVILSAADIRAVAHVPGCRASGLEIVNQSSVQPVLTRPAKQQAFNSQIMVPMLRISFWIILLFIDSVYSKFFMREHTSQDIIMLTFKSQQNGNFNARTMIMV